MFKLMVKIFGESRVRSWYCSIDELIISISGDDPFSMSTISAKESGVNGTIYISQIGTDINKAKIIVYPNGAQNRHVFYHVSVSDNPRVIRKSLRARFTKIQDDDVANVFEFVKINKDLLLRFWGDRNMCFSVFYDNMKSLKGRMVA